MNTVGYQDNKIVKHLELIANNTGQKRLKPQKIKLVQLNFYKV